MDVIPPVRFNLTGDRYRLTLGSIWKQPFVYFVRPDPGSFIGQIQEVTKNTPAYLVQLPGGEYLEDILSEGVDVFGPGDWVYVHRVYGVWKISGVAELEDMSEVLRIKCQVRTKAGGRTILEFDTQNSSDDTVSHAKKVPIEGTSFELYAPPQFSIAPSTYEYDIFFYYSASEPYEPVMRQFGVFEVVDRITQVT